MELHCFKLCNGLKKENFLKKRKGHLGEALKPLRLATGMSQEEFAHRCKLDRSFMSDLETDKKGPSLLTIFKLAKGLGMKAKDLVGEIEENIDFDSIFEEEPEK
ncbi:helix-turn-helix domain-containing protein [Neobacillus drentensis]|uniref:helix-turn-helix domain-containing protein n=1 Tax=Neobacillus drentensis TaxID=220684 RepID=UPI002FFF4698